MTEMTWPAAARASTTCDPMKPEAPVIPIRIFLIDDRRLHRLHRLECLFERIQDVLGILYFHFCGDRKADVARAYPLRLKQPSGWITPEDGLLVAGGFVYFST